MPAALKIPGTTITGVPIPPPAYVLEGLAKSTPGVVGLFEIGHPALALTGIPASVPDLAADWTMSTLGAAAPAFTIANTVVNGEGKAYAERTSKGGLHIASAQAGATSPYQNVQIGLTTARSTYLSARATAGDSIYVGVWFRFTRGVASGYTDSVPVAGARRSNNAADFYSIVGTMGNTVYTNPPAGNARLVGRRAERTGSLAYGSVAGVGALSGTYANSTTLSILGAFQASTLNKVASLAVYRIYVENLTATGRSFSTVDTAHYAEYTDQCLTPGGRYYADTWTEPTSVLA